MAKKKNKSRKQGFFSKAVNAALILLGFSRAIRIIVASPNQGGVEQLIDEATFGLGITGQFDLTKGLLMYSPVGAALGLGTLKSYLMRKFPVR